MDIRAFGTIYGQESKLPYASGFHWAPSDGQKDFPTCRGLYVEAKSTPGTDNVYIALNDAPGQLIQIEILQGNEELPFGAITLSGGSVQGIIALY